jgi:hypothetical protein
MEECYIRVYNDPPWGRTLSAGDCSLSDLKSLKLKNINRLSIYRSSSEIIPQLEDTIEVLRIENCDSLKGLTNFPKALYFLSIDECPSLDTSSWPPFPPGLTSLEINSCNLKELPPIAHTSITELVVPRNELTTIPELPESVETIDITANPITSLPKLTNNLNSLIADETLLQKIPRLPSAMAEITLHDAPLVEPFRRFYKEYSKIINENTDGNYKQGMVSLKEKVNTYYNSIRNLSSLQLVSKTEGISRVTENGKEQYIPNVLPLIGSFLSGKKGTVKQQLESFQRGGKSRRTKKSRKSRKTRKH